MSDYHQLWKTLFVIKDFLIQHDVDKFSSFDLTIEPKKIHGNSFRFIVESATDVIYFLKFYELLGDITEKDIDSMYAKKGFVALDKVYLILSV